MLSVKKLFSIIIITIMLVTTIQYQCSAALVRHLQLENAVVNSDWSVTDNGVNWKEKGLQHNNVEIPYISSLSSTGSGHSLRLIANPYNGTESQQRVEFRAESGGVPLYSWRYVSYEFMVDESSRPNSIITQFRQYGDSSNPIGELRVANSDGNWYLNFQVKNTEYNLIDPNAIGSTIYLMQNIPFEKGQWQKLVIGFKPDASKTNTGAVKIWHNSTQVVNWVGKLGYPENYLGRSIEEKYEIAFGIYRPKQNNLLKIYFDNFKHGTTYADVVYANNIVNLNSVADAEIQYGTTSGGTTPLIQDRRDRNYGAISTIRLNRNSSASNMNTVCKGYLKFEDNTSLSTVTSAQLKLNVTGFASGGTAFRVYGLIGADTVHDWEEGAGTGVSTLIPGITWNIAANPDNGLGNVADGPGVVSDNVFGGTHLGTVTVNDIGTYTVDVTNYIKSLNGQKATFILISTSGNTYIATKENGIVDGPKLVLERPYILNSVADAEIQYGTTSGGTTPLIQDRRDRNYGANTTIRLNRNSSASNMNTVCKGYINFVDNISLSTVTSAQLKLNVTGFASGGTAFRVYGLIGADTVHDWEEGAGTGVSTLIPGITWNIAANPDNGLGNVADGPGVVSGNVFGGTHLGTVTVNDTGTYTVDVTNYIKSLNGQKATFILISTSGNTYIATKENGIVDGPKLVLER